MPPAKSTISNRANYPSIASSVGTEVFTPKHKYNTRSSAKFWTSSSQTSLNTENSLLNDISLQYDSDDSQYLGDNFDYSRTFDCKYFDHHKTLDYNNNKGENLNYKNLDYKNFNNANSDLNTIGISKSDKTISKSYKIISQSYKTISKYPLLLESMRTVRRRPAGINYNLDNCEPINNYNNYAKYYKIFVLLVAVGLIGGAVALVFSSFEQINQEIIKIKSDLGNMQEQAKFVATGKDQTDKKLDQIGELLVEMKKSHGPPLKFEAPKGKIVCQEALRSTIKEILDEYDADKTGRTDYALESAGGKVVSIKHTENYPSGAVKFLGVTLCSNNNEPRLMITPGNNPGECWAFKGSSGLAVIELVDTIHVTGVTMEHIPKSLSPSGNIATAPKEFSILGLPCSGDTNSVLLGNFTYDENGPPLQYFPIGSSKQAFRLIEFQVSSNHGSKEFTCVYRLRVHGDLEHGPESTVEHSRPATLKTN